jgi:cephalosporin hydroxylase
MLPLMSLREHVKSRLTKDQRKRVLRAIVAVRVFFDAPRRAFNRASIERRLPALPGGRGWRTAIPPALHRSLQLGILDYRYRGVQMGKHPVEIALYMRLIGEMKPGTIIEIGTESGGAAIWMADVLKMLNIDGRVLSIDLKPPSPPYVPANVKFLAGDANDLGLTLTPDILASLSRPWLVIEDSSHQFAATLAVLQFFDPLLRSEEYIVVEDGNMTEMGSDDDRDGGPARAITEFLAARGQDYEIDAAYCDHYGRNVTGNPNGYLRKK